MLVHGDKPEAKKSNKYVEIKKVNTKYIHKTCSCHPGFSSMGRNDEDTLFFMFHFQFSGP